MNQRGGVLLYIMFSVVLLALLTALGLQSVFGLKIVHVKAAERSAALMIMEGVHASVSSCLYDLNFPYANLHTGNPCHLTNQQRTCVPTTANGYEVSVDFNEPVTSTPPGPNDAPVCQVTIYLSPPKIPAALAGL